MKRGPGMMHPKSLFFPTFPKISRHDHNESSKMSGGDMGRVRIRRPADPTQTKWCVSLKICLFGIVINGGGKARVKESSSKKSNFQTSSPADFGEKSVTHIRETQIRGTLLPFFEIGWMIILVGKRLFEHIIPDLSPLVITIQGISIISRDWARVNRTEKETFWMHHSRPLYPRPTNCCDLFSRYARPRKFLG